MTANATLAAASSRTLRHDAAKADRQIAHWLLAVAALVFCMVVLGGVTRLTESGLSIVEWQPLIGAIPPLSEADWQALFAKYQATPEYQKVNLGMTLEGFKEIFWLEYLHRLLGRAIGVAFLLPFLYFLVRRRIRRGLAPQLAVMFVLGALQGALGWYMVKSGLSDRPDVSPYRLAAHLVLATAIYLYMLWVALGLLAPRGPKARQGRGPRLVRVYAPALLGLTLLTLTAGAFVAGNDAGLAYNSFPLMDGRLVPQDLFPHEPAWRNGFEGLALVQLNHRLLAYLTVLGALGLVIASGAYGTRSGLSVETRRVVWLVAGLALGQAGLGVVTLLLYVPIALGAAHQGGALLLLTALLWASHSARRAEGAPTSRRTEGTPGLTSAAPGSRRPA
ncbi:MAG: COX15/CtaA family protein [Alphaproteobacteria bacterium]